MTGSCGCGVGKPLQSALIAFGARMSGAVGYGTINISYIGCKT